MGFSRYPLTRSCWVVWVATAEQTYGIDIGPDTNPPALSLTASATRFAPGEVTQLSVSARDDVLVQSLALTIDGIDWPLDANGLTAYQSQVPGAHVALALDTSGNRAQAQLLLAVTQAADIDAPVVSFAPGVAECVYSYIHDLSGTVQDANLLRYRLSVRRNGSNVEHLLGEGTTPVQNAKLGTLDATQLEDGVYQLRLYAEDVYGLTTELVRPVRIDGAAKVGVVQFSVVDMVVPMAGMPLTVVRSYDSRLAGEQGDFGAGWRLEVRHGSVANNRPVGEYFALFSGDTGGGGFELPCQRMNEQRPHLTEVRLSEREWYLFAPRLANTDAISGGCTADVFFEQIDGSTRGAELVINGNTTVRADRSVRVADESIDESSPMNLLDAYTLDLYDPQSFQLQLADGRFYDLSASGGILRMADRNNNWLFFEPDRIAHSDGKQLDIERDAQGRITLIRDPSGHSVRYFYDANGDLVASEDPENRTTRYRYYSAPAHALRSVVKPDGVEVAAMSYTPDGRLEQSCELRP